MFFQSALRPQPIAAAPVTATAIGWRVLGLCAVTALFVVLYYLASADVAVHPGGDTVAFENVARTQLTWDNIFSTQRPPIYPLLFRLTGYDHALVVDVQFAVYFVVWIALAWAFWRAVPGLLGVAAAACVFYVGLFPHFAAWNHVLMSESLSVSMTVGAFACLTAYLTNPRWPSYTGFVALMCLKCFLRDFDAFLCVFFIPVLLVFGWYRTLSWWAVAVTISIFLALFMFVSHGADATGLGPGMQRWYFAMMDNVGRRVLPDARWLAFFRAHGMPVNDTLLSMTGRFAHEENWRFFVDPRLEAFRDWINTAGRGTYTAYLLHHPLFILVALWRARADVFQPVGFPMNYYFDPAWQFALPPGNAMGPIYVLGSAGCVLMLALLALRRLPVALRATAATAVLMWLMILPIALTVYHADAMELLRHALPVLLQAALSLLLMLLVLLRWVSARA